MFGNVSPTFILNAGALGLVLLILFSLFAALRNGTLYTKSALEKIEKSEQARSAKAEEREDQWRVIAEKWQTTALVANEQTSKLLEQGRLTVQLLEAIRDAQAANSGSSYVGARRRDGS